MERYSLPFDARLHFFSDMISSCYTTYLSHFDSNNSLISTNAPCNIPINLLFNLCLDSKQHNFFNETAKEILLTSKLQMAWLIIPIHTEQTLIVFGPFFIGHASFQQIISELNMRNLSVSLTKACNDMLLSIPAFSSTTVTEFGNMLYYTIFEEYLSLDQTKHLNFTEKYASDDSISPRNQSQFHGTYYAEQQMLLMVREGNLNYKDTLARLSVSGSPGMVSDEKHPDRQIKNLQLAAVTIVSRAAIEGGLNPEIAYALADYYFQVVESNSSLSEANDFMTAMLDDFITHVHDAKQDKFLSKEVKEFKDYLDFFCENKINLNSIAALYGYDNEYLIKKFKKEMGITPREYLKNKKMEKAKYYLESTNLSPREISKILNFSSQSYFNKVFKDYYDYTPTQR